MDFARDMLCAAVIGVGASLLMDLWNLFLKRALRVPSLDYALLGRWIAHMPSGTFRHASIVRARPMPFERPLGWAAHYAIGAGLGVGFVVVASREWLARPTLRPALLWGIGTLVFPMFVLQPALGLGIASSKTAHPVQARLKSLATHRVFGVGLFGCALVLDIFLRTRIG